MNTPTEPAIHGFTGDLQPAYSPLLPHVGILTRRSRVLGGHDLEKYDLPRRTRSKSVSQNRPYDTPIRRRSSSTSRVQPLPVVPEHTAITGPQTPISVGEDVIELEPCEDDIFSPQSCTSNNLAWDDKDLSETYKCSSRNDVSLDYSKFGKCSRSDSLQPVVGSESINRLITALNKSPNSLSRGFPEDYLDADRDSLFSNGSVELRHRLDCVEEQENFDNTIQEIFNSHPLFDEKEFIMVDDDVLEYRNELEMLNMFVEDDIEPVNVEEVTLEYLKNLLKDAIEWKDKCRKAIVSLKTRDDVYYATNLEKNAVADKKKIVDFVLLAQKKLKDAENVVTINQSTPVEYSDTSVKNIKARRVTQLEADTLNDIDDLVAAFAQLNTDDLETDLSYRQAEEKYRTLSKRAETVKADAKALCRDAIDTGLEQQLNNIEGKVRVLSNTQIATEARLQKIKIDLNIYSFGNAKISDLKPPSFSGDQTDKLDWYSFRKEFEQYAAVKNVTKNELLRLLIKTCLIGTARTACEHFETMEEVFAHMEKMYGNVQVLLANKIGEIRKIGSCSGTNIKKREWALSVKSKLTAVLDLAKKYKLEEELYHSPIVYEIQRGLPTKLLDEFKDELRTSEDDCLSKRDLFHRLNDFMETVIKDFTFEITYSIASGNLIEESTIKQDKNSQNGRSPANTQKQNNRSPSNAEKETKKVYNNKQTDGSGQGSTKSKRFSGVDEKGIPPAKVAKCQLCQDSHTHIYYCPIFQQADEKERYNITKDAKTCFRCMRTETCVDLQDRKAWWEGHKDLCDGTWTCQVGRCRQKYRNRQSCFLLCLWHADSNKKKHEDFIKSLDKKLVDPNLTFFYNVPIMVNWQMNNSNPGKAVKGWTVNEDVTDPCIYMMQYVLVEGHKLLVFYDSGCMTASISERAASLLETEVIRPGPTDLYVAAGEIVTIPGGEERFTLPMNDGVTRATITAIKMQHVTTAFPIWEMGEAIKDAETLFDSTYPQFKNRPKFPKVIGGCEVDIMLGIRYSKYFPEFLCATKDGLGVYRAKFLAPMGCDGVLAGPHSSWRSMRDSSHFMSSTVFFSRSEQVIKLELIKQKKLYEGIFHLDPDHNEDLGHDDVLCKFVDEELLQPNVPLHVERCLFQHCERHLADADWMIPLSWDFENSKYSAFSSEKLERLIQSENAGTVIEYRCQRCRNCPLCKKGEVLEHMSLKEEKEQFMIETCVKLVEEERILVAKLPFVADPTLHLKPNFCVANKVFETQMKLIRKDEQTRIDVLASHNKLLLKGHVCRYNDLPKHVKEMVDDGPGYFIPWHCVWKSSSLSTPCRMVFDASARSPGGDSLNNVLAKGANTLSNLFTILLKFRLKLSGFCADVSMAYNGVRIDESHYKYQKYLFKEDLLDDNKIDIMVIKTLIYGVKPSGNITIAAFNKLADHCEENYPENEEGAAVLKKDAYMDDVVSGQDSLAKAISVSEQLKFTLGIGSMSVKEITIAGSSPTDKVSSDGRHIGLVGMLWEPKADLVGIDIKELYLGKPKRGKLPDPVKGDVATALKGKFNRRIITGKVAGVFDPLGLATAKTAKFKLHLHDLCKLKLDWDDNIPEEFLERWVSNLDDIQMLKDIRFRRSVVHPDAESLDVSLIISSDASKEIAIATVHSRMRLKSGQYHVQLVCAKSKIVTDLTVPRAELRAAVVATTLSYCTKVSLGERLRDVFHVTDSTIVLYWLSQDQRPLQTAVRNAVIEIRRLSNPNSWYHVDSENNVADIGTRSDLPVDLSLTSEWQIGKSWMRLPSEDMPIRTIEQITLTSEERRLASKETKAQDINGIVLVNLQSKVSDRCSFSKYIIDPNRFSWPKTVRALSYAFRFIDKLKVWIKPWFPPTKEENNLSPEELVPNDWEISRAENYFFFKASQEVKQFAKSTDWKDCSTESGKILRYNSRIVEGQIVGTVAEEGLDVHPLMFVRPMVERFSPVAYSIMTYCHSHLARHRNSAATLRESRYIAFILQGRNLANEIRENCPFCKRYRAVLLKREMGKIHDSRLYIAPAFYNVQVDLLGPLTAICEHNHRSTVKVYGVVFKDPSTSAVSIHCMQAYHASAFVQAYTRFSSRYGHPAKINIDEGSQLVKAMKEMEYSLLDVTRQFATEFRVGVDYRTCPVGAHNAHGSVERSVLEVKRLLNQVCAGIKMDIMSYETAFSWIANELNNFPICLGSRTAKLDQIDLITPSRLLHGRNNRRSLAGPVKINVPSRLMKQIEIVEAAWWKVWQTERIIEFIPQPPKWKESTGVVNEGDVVIFLKTDKEISLGGPVWRIGRIREVEKSKDGVSRTVCIEYRNNSESTFRSTRRSIRKIAILHSENSIELVDQLNQAYKEQTIQFLMSTR